MSDNKSIGRLVRHRDRFAEYDISLIDCPWYRRCNKLPGFDPEGICDSGCREEPSCQTDEPYGGWPDKTTRLYPRHHRRTVVKP